MRSLLPLSVTTVIWSVLLSLNFLVEPVVVSGQETSTLPDPPCDAARWSKRFLVACSILLMFSGLTRSTALAQESFSSTTHDSSLPDAPQPQQVTSSSGARDSQQTGSGIITGTVLDTNRDVLQGARVTLVGLSDSALRTVESGMNGQFAFTGLAPDV